MKNGGWQHLDNHLEKMLEDNFLSKPLFLAFLAIRKRESSIFTLELSQKSDFQHSTTKPDNIGYPTVKTGQI